MQTGFPLFSPKRAHDEDYTPRKRAQTCGQTMQAQVDELVVRAQNAVGMIVEGLVTGDRASWVVRLECVMRPSVHCCDASFCALRIYYVAERRVCASITAPRGLPRNSADPMYACLHRRARSMNMALEIHCVPFGRLLESLRQRGFAVASNHAFLCPRCPELRIA